jgi:predicted DNA-binding antitoxin AbrB/MazE fold protein
LPGCPASVLEKELRDTSHILGERKKKRFLSAKIKLILVIGMAIRIKARYENEMLKPLEKLELEEGEEVEIEVKKNPVEMLEGMIKISNKKWVDEIIESPDLEPV